MRFDRTNRFKDKEVQNILGKWYDTIKQLSKEEGQSKQFAKCVGRIVANSINGKCFNKYCPLAAEILRKEFGRNILYELKNTNLIDKLHHDQRNHKCSGYRPTEYLIMQLLNTNNVIAGQKNKIIRKNKYTRKLNNGKTITYYPDIVQNSMQYIASNRFKLNYSAVDQYFNNIVKLIRECQDSVKFRNLVGRYTSDVFALNILVNDKNTILKNDIIEASCCYKGQVGGRLSENKRGFQGCTRVLKYCLLYNMNYINFDLRKAQLYCLKQLLVDYNISTTILDC